MYAALELKDGVENGLADDRVAGLVEGLAEQVHVGLVCSAGLDGTASVAASAGAVVGSMLEERFMDGSMARSAKAWVNL